MKIDGAIIRKDMKRAAIFFGAVVILILAVVFIYPLLNRQKEKWLVNTLETKIMPFLQANDIKGFVDRDNCKAIHYHSIFATDPVRCTYVNQTEQQFSDADRILFNKTRQVLSNAMLTNIVDIGTEYTRYDSPTAPRPPEAVGTAFYVSCFFCRTRYVYWPDYKALPQGWEGEISYTPINKNWYRVEEDWN
jgi:hypothetical protein